MHIFIGNLSYTATPQYRQGELFRREGFTLLEVLIVVIIVGVLAAVAMPLLTRQIERARATEAVHELGHIRNAMEACYLARNMSDYQGCNFLDYMGDPFVQPQSHFELLIQDTPADGGYFIVVNRNTYELSDSVGLGNPGNVGISCGSHGAGTSATSDLIGLCRAPDGTLSITGVGMYEGMRW
jgi:prepilin-type N-terminal cleavage/methylation domain-containing protein